MTTLSITLKIIPYLAAAGIPSFLFIRSAIKKNRDHNKEIEEKDKTIQSLRSQIFEMAILEGEKKDVTEKGKIIKKNINSSVDIDTAYADKLPVMPKKPRPRKSTTD